MKITEASKVQFANFDRTMKSILVLCLLGSVVFAQIPQKLDFDYTKLKSIWESPRLSSFAKNLNIKASANNGRIVGGDYAVAGQFPHHVLTIIDGGYWCGGSIIKPDWVLTAAHCVEETSSVEIYSILSLDIGFYWRTVAAKIIIHEDYGESGRGLYNDIALYKTATSASFNFYTNYIDLPRDSSTFDNFLATIQGFGMYSDDIDDVSSHKRFVQMPITSNANCASIWEINGSHVCTDTTGGKDSCGGDSGGGLFVGDVSGNIHERQVVGIVSYGSVRCESGLPSVYTRVSYFVGWINNKINTN